MSAHIFGRLVGGLFVFIVNMVASAHAYGWLLIPNRGCHTLNRKNGGPLRGLGTWMAGASPGQSWSS